jgi:hypothetical protein
MEYGQLISRSISVVWRHRYLWLLAILGGADVGSCSPGFNASYRQSFNSVGVGSQSAQQVGQFLNDNLGVILVIVFIALLVAAGWWLLSCVTIGAVVRASAEHDAERPFGLGWAWRTGLATFGSIVRLRLLGLLLGLAVIALIGLFVLLGFLSYLAGQPAALAVVVVVGVLVVIALIPFSILTGILFILATRSVVLEQRGAVAAISRGLQLMRARFGRTLLVWLIQVGLSIAVAVAALVAFLVLALVLGALAVAAFAVAGGAGAIVVGLPAALVLIAAALVVAGIAGSYFSTYWTLAFRRLELDRPPAPAWPPPQWSPPQPPAGYPPQPSPQ